MNESLASVRNKKVPKKDKFCLQTAQEMTCINKRFGVLVHLIVVLPPYLRFVVSV
jgi:hypothetical protein